MRVLIAHRWYGTHVPSGEDRAVEEDIRELTDAGVEVFCSMPEGAGPSPGGLEASSRYSRYSPIEIAKSGARLLDRVQPDLVHVHNPYPEYLALLHALGKAGRPPLVHTVHNLRHLCPAGSALRDGLPCDICADRRLAIPAVRHRCMNGSAVKSLGMAGMVALSGRSEDAADLRIAPSSYMRDRLEATARPGDGPVVVLPNAVIDPGPGLGRPADAPSEPYVFFAGRLSASKGVDLLVAAVESLPSSSPLQVVIAGEGELRDLVESAAGRCRRIHFAGQLGKDDVHGSMAGAAAVVVPSVVEESFGLTVAEALACATPVVVSSRGALAEVAGECGVVVEPTVAQLRDALVAVEAEPSAEVRRLARQRWETMFSPQTRGPALLSLYRRTLGNDT